MQMLNGATKIPKHAFSRLETDTRAILVKLKKSMTILPDVSVGRILMVLLLVTLKNSENYQINKLIISKIFITSNCF